LSSSDSKLDAFLQWEITDVVVVVVVVVVSVVGRVLVLLGSGSDDRRLV
jgi:hypothetical protein